MAPLQPPPRTSAPNPPLVEALAPTSTLFRRPILGLFLTYFFLLKSY